MNVSGSHTLNELFAQLGLASDDKAIADFVKTHKLTSANCLLSEAPWWNKSQAEFLRSAFDADAEWAMPVDQLNTLLLN